jgi:hypothetical protein
MQDAFDESPQSEDPDIEMMLSWQAMIDAAPCAPRPSDRPTLGRRKAEQIGEIIGVLVQTEPGKVTAVTDMGRCTLLRQGVTGAGDGVSVPEETLTAIHDTLRLVWSRELSADDGMDEIEILIPPTKTDDWIKCSERLPDLGQRVILQSNGVIQNYMPLFDQGDSDLGMGDHFWDFEDINDIDNPLVDFENDSWMPRPEQLNQEQGQ